MNSSSLYIDHKARGIFQRGELNKYRLSGIKETLISTLALRHEFLHCQVCNLIDFAISLQNGRINGMIDKLKKIPNQTNKQKKKEAKTVQEKREMCLCKIFLFFYCYNAHTLFDID